ncbi:MAG TPA: SGNH/GDSL hydrolase family protein [Stellaceae bacterium]|nr:SGNH/GDSL hydrolase family protein [Stellaceae bacterium]
MNGALAGLVILALGDSHMVYMVSPLHDALEEQGATVNTYAMCGAMAEDWLTRTTTQCFAERHDKGAAVVKNQPAPTWLLTDLLERNRPNLVVIELGDNMAGYGTLGALPRDFIRTQVDGVLGPIRARHLPCVWIGPPWGKDTAAYHKTELRTKELSQFLAQAVAPCAYIDTTSLARPGEWPTYDGEHLSQASYRKWSLDITGAIIGLKGRLH